MNIIFALDNDTAGRGALKRSLDILDNAKPLKGRICFDTWEEAEEYWDQQDRYEAKLERIEAEYVNPKDTAEPFFNEGVSREWVFEIRREALKNDYEKTYREFLANRKTEKEKNRSKLNYELHTYKPEGKMVSDQEIERAREKRIDEFVKVEHGFALCPFHKEKTASMSVTKNLYYCFGACGVGGDVINFVQRLRGISFREAVRFLNNA